MNELSTDCLRDQLTDWLTDLMDGWMIYLELTIKIVSYNVLYLALSVYQYRRNRYIHSFSSECSIS